MSRQNGVAAIRASSRDGAVSRATSHHPAALPMTSTAAAATAGQNQRDRTRGAGDATTTSAAPITSSRYSPTGITSRFGSLEPGPA